MQPPDQHKNHINPLCLNMLFVCITQHINILRASSKQKNYNCVNVCFLYRYI